MRKPHIVFALLGFTMSASATAQASEPIVFDPRVIQLQRPPEQSPPPPSMQVPREAGAGNISVDSSTFDMFAQMIKRFNRLEERLDQLSRENAALSQQLTEARRAIESSDERLSAFMLAAARDPHGRTLIGLMCSTCSMVEELLIREKSPDVATLPFPVGVNVETAGDIKHVVC